MSLHTQEILQSESNKRLYFVLKLILLTGLIIIYARIESVITFISGISPDIASPMLHVFRAFFFALSANILISLTRLVSIAIYIRQRNARSRERNVVLAVNRIAFLLNVLSVIIAGFLLFGLSWDNFFGTFSLVAVATAILIKEYINNTFNGLINMISERIALGDWVKIGNLEGIVTDITLSNVYLKDEEGHNISIPNNNVFVSDIVDYNRESTALLEVSFEARPEAVSDLDYIRTIIINKLKPFEYCIMIDDTQLFLKEVEIDKVKMVCRIRIMLEAYPFKKEIRHTVLHSFFEFQQTLHPGVSA
jgi:small-conductance mechanosensitive channel